MSLDVYLTVENKVEKESSGIFIREDGQNKEISLDEWRARFPDRAPVVVPGDTESNVVYSANITHNLNKMAREADLYRYLWRPDENGAAKAGQLIDPLRLGLFVLESNPERFKQFNPSNGWGTYEGLVEFVRRYLAACQEYPDAEVSVSR